MGSLECGLLVRKPNKNLDKLTLVFRVTCNVFIFLVNLSKQVFNEKKEKIMPVYTNRPD